MTDYLFRPPYHTPESRAGRPPRPRTEMLPGMLIDRDVAVTVSPGEPIYVGVYRPDSPVPAAPLIAWSPYGKHNPAPIGILYPRSGVKPEHTSALTTFEAPDPQYWVPHGCAIVTADIPGTWYSRGRATYLSPEEARAFAELIEWAGTQPWSNGRVGLSGVPYLTSSQWRVAELSPPHLAAINPWEGVVRHLPRGRQARRDPGDLVLALYLAALGRERDRDRGPGGGDRRAPVLRRLLAVQERRPGEDHRPGLRGGELVRPRPALPRHAGGIPADLLRAQVARRARG